MQSTRRAIKKTLVLSSNPEKANLSRFGIRAKNLGRRFGTRAKNLGRRIGSSA